MLIIPAFLDAQAGKIYAIFTRPNRVVDAVRPRDDIKAGDAEKVIALVLWITFEMIFYKCFQLYEVAKLARVRIGTGKQGDTAAE